MKIFLAASLTVLTSLACGSKTGGGTDGNTQFWDTCSTDSECGSDNECICGRCTTECTTADECTYSNTECAPVSTLSACSRDQPVCVPKGALYSSETSDGSSESRSPSVDATNFPEAGIGETFERASSSIAQPSGSSQTEAPPVSGPSSTSQPSTSETPETSEVAASSREPSSSGGDGGGSFTCSAAPLVVDVAWQLDSSEVECDLENCIVSSPKAAVAPDGTTWHVAYAQQPDGEERSGLILQRISAGGQTISLELIEDFALEVGSSLQEPNDLSVDTDGQLWMTVIASTNEGSDPAFDVALLRFGSDGASLGGPTFLGVSSSVRAQALAPDGGVYLALADGVLHVSSSNETTRIGTRPVGATLLNANINTLGQLVGKEIREVSGDYSYYWVSLLGDGTLAWEESVEANREFFAAPLRDGTSVWLEYPPPGLDAPNERLPLIAVTRNAQGNASTPEPLALFPTPHNNLRATPVEDAEGNVYALGRVATADSYRVAIFELDMNGNCTTYRIRDPFVPSATLLRLGPQRTFLVGDSSTVGYVVLPQ